MNLEFNLGTFLSGLGVAGIGWVLSIVRSMNTKLGVINGRVGRVETWQTAHDKQDDERHEETRVALSELKEKQ